MSDNKYFKYEEGAKFAYCANCYQLMKRLYIRGYDGKNKQKWIAIGWSCHPCKVLARDEDPETTKF